MDNREEIVKEIQDIMNKYSIDTLTDTPDYVLAEYLYSCLCNYIIAKERTEEFFDKKNTINCGDAGLGE